MAVHVFSEGFSFLVSEHVVRVSRMLAHLSWVPAILYQVKGKHHTNGVENLNIKIDVIFI